MSGKPEKSFTEDLASTAVKCVSTAAGSVAATAVGAAAVGLGVVAAPVVLPMFGSYQSIFHPDKTLGQKAYDAVGNYAGWIKGGVTFEANGAYTRVSSSVEEVLPAAASAIGSSASEAASSVASAASAAGSYYVNNISPTATLCRYVTAPAPVAEEAPEAVATEAVAPAPEATLAGDAVHPADLH